MKTRIAIGLVAGIATMWHPSTASAALTTFAAFSGNVGVSVEAGGSVQSTLPNGLTADIPAGSTILAAYLYTSTYDETFTTGSTIPSASAGGTFGGTPVSYTALIPNSSSDLPLQAGVADVTSIVQSVVNPSGIVATGGVYNFAVTETNTGEQDGEVLVAVYSNPSIPTSSIGILDGAASSAGDSAAINFSANPAGSTVLLSIGDGFSYDLGGGGQSSTIMVDGSTLTTAAGNCDESQDGGTPPNATNCADGDLITAGTLGLNADGSVDTSYSNPFTTIGDTDTSTDHELYNISSLIDPSAGNTITTTTMNSSRDDNIFLEVYDVNGLAGFNAPPPPPSGTPDPATFVLAGLGLSGIGLFRRSRRSPKA